MVVLNVWCVARHVKIFGKNKLKIKKLTLAKIYTVPLRTKQTYNAFGQGTPNALKWPTHFCRRKRPTCFWQRTSLCYS